MEITKVHQHIMIYRISLVHSRVGQNESRLPQTDGFPKIMSNFESALSLSTLIFLLVDSSKVGTNNWLCIQLALSE